MNDLRASLTAFLTQQDITKILRPMVRLIARGKPVELTELAEQTEFTVGQVSSWLHGQSGTDWDSQGRLVGFGLTQRTTPHRFTVADQQLFTFCAADTLLFTPLLGSPTKVESTCPTTGRPIRLRLAPDSVLDVHPGTTVISQVLCSNTDIRASVCDHGHFFTSFDATEPWRQAHLDGWVTPVRDYFDVVLSTIRDIGWS